MLITERIRSCFGHGRHVTAACSPSKGTSPSLPSPFGVLAYELRRVRQREVCPPPNVPRSRTLKGVCRNINPRTGHQTLNRVGRPNINPKRCLEANITLNSVDGDSANPKQCFAGGPSINPKRSANKKP